MKLVLILGNCLFQNHKLLEPDDKTIFFMAEDYGLCRYLKYHKHKLIMILSAMRSHRDELQKNYIVEYFELNKESNELSFEEKLLKSCAKYDIKEIVTYDIENHFFRNRLKAFSKKNNLQLKIKSSPAFLTSHEKFLEYKKSFKRLFMNDFYIWQRKRLNILVTEDGKPINEKWSFDKENRKKLPKNIFIPKLPDLKITKNTKQASELVDDYFKDHPGEVNNFYLPTTRKQAISWLDNFFINRFTNFGPYEDAISSKDHFVFHSVLSPLINIGLLTPPEIIEKALTSHDNNDVPFQSLEGFVRQIIGWREFIRGVYNTNDFRQNFFNHKRKLNSKWYSGETGIPPLDTVIKRVNKYGYCHHIERLMVISNLMLLCEIDPEEVNRWFTELFVDSSDWVMEPNVYGMGQFADGGSFATKPYISGSNYILKMSDFKKGDWCDTWDGLYWRFINKHRKFFSGNSRMSMMVRMLDKINEDKRIRIFKLAEEFIESATN